MKTEREQDLDCNPPYSPNLVSVYDRFQLISLFPTKEIVSLFVISWCKLLAERTYLRCHCPNTMGAIEVTWRTHERACTEDSVAILKVCFDENIDKLCLSLAVSSGKY